MVGGGGVYGGGETADRRISVGESSEEWLISTVRTMEMMCWEWEDEGICCVVGVVNADWGCGWWIVEVYKGFSRRAHWGLYRCVVFLLERLDNNCQGAWECLA